MAEAAEAFFHILNPNAEKRSAVKAFIDGKPWRRIWVDRDSHPTHLETIAQWAVNEGQRDLAVWGGDGTFSRLVNALGELGALDRVQLALIPAGTCNDFARKMMTVDWRRAAEAASFSHRRIDVGVLSHAAGERLFVNNAGFGRRPEARRSTRPSPIADIWRMRAETLDVAWRDGGRTGRERLAAMLGIFFNAPYFGGGMHFDSSISPDDGRLDAFLVKDQPRLRLLWTFIKGRMGRPFDATRAVHMGGSEITVTSRGGDLYPQADGETASPAGVREITFSIRPGALQLRVPE